MPTSSIRSSSTHRGSQNPSTLRIRIGFLCRPSCAQVICSTSSSRVPTPPGKATKASARSNITRLRSCMSGVTIRSCTRVSMCSRLTRKSGMTPVTSPAVVEDRFGEGAHQADGAAAIDQANAVLGQNSPKAGGRLHVGGILAGTGGAIDADRFDCAHGRWMWPQGSGPSSHRVAWPRRRLPL